MNGLLLSVLLSSSYPVPEPPIVSREAWGAKPRLAGAKSHVIKKITIHHTGVKSAPARSLEDKLRGLQTFSQRVDKLASGKEKPAWPDIPYHYYISYDGRIGEGREWFFAGDTNTEYDPTGHLLIVVEGEFGVEQPSEAELKSLRELTIWCAFKWRVPSTAIEGHDDHSKETSCPGANLKPELPKLRALVKEKLGQ